MYATSTLLATKAVLPSKESQFNAQKKPGKVLCTFFEYNVFVTTYNTYISPVVFSALCLVAFQVLNQALLLDRSSVLIF